YRFGPFDVHVGRRLLTRSGLPVPVGSRALDILCLLVARAGEIVSKDAIIAHVWPTTFVDDANLRVQIGRLRKALGDGRYIINVPVRGYCFVAPVAHTALLFSDADRMRLSRGVSTHVQALRGTP